MNDNKQEQTGSEIEREQPEAAAPEVTETPQTAPETAAAPETPEAPPPAQKSGGAVRKTRVLFGVLALIVLALLTVVVFRVLDGGQPLPPTETPLPMASDDPNRVQRPEVTETPAPTPPQAPGVAPDLDLSGAAIEPIGTAASPPWPPASRPNWT